MSGGLRLLQALFTFAILASGAVLAAAVQRIATRRAAPDTPQIACMAGATLLYALNALLAPGRAWGTALVSGGLLLAAAAIVLHLRARPRR